jgi:hypothetical protein
MIPARGLPRLGPEPLAGQEQLFVPTPPEPPSFDETCPPTPDAQLELEVGAAIRTRSQTTLDEFANAGA